MVKLPLVCSDKISFAVSYLHLVCNDKISFAATKLPVVTTEKLYSQLSLQLQKLPMASKPKAQYYCRALQNICLHLCKISVAA